MGQKYIVLGRKADKSIEMLASPSVEFGRQKLELQRHARAEKFEEVQMFALVPHTRAYHPAATLKMEADIKAQEEAGKKPPITTPPADDPEQFIGKTDAEIHAAAKGLKLEIPADAKRSDIIAAIIKVSETADPGKQKGFFAKLFGGK